MAEKGTKGFVDALFLKSTPANFVFSWLGLIIVGSFLVVAGSWGLHALIPAVPFIGAQSLIGGTTGMQAQAPPATGGAAGQLPNCGNSPPILSLASYYLDPNNNNLYTQVATTYGIYQAGAPVAADSGTTSASNVTSSNANKLSCGASYREIMGDAGTTYYYARTGDFVADNAIVPLANGGKGLEVIASGAASAQVKSTGSLFASTMTFNWTAAGGTNGSVDSTSLKLYVQQPSKPQMFGDLGQAYCFRYNSSDFTTLRAEGGNLVSVPHVKATATHDTVLCYEFPPQAGSTSAEYPIYADAAPAGVVNGSTVDFILVDKTNELYNGYLIPNENTAAGVMGNGYDQLNNQNTGLGRADVTTNSFITFTR